MRERRCALYVRVASLPHAGIEESCSLDAQEAKLRAYVDNQSTGKNAACQVVGVYREEGCSGYNLNRPEFWRMMGDIESDKINMLIICSIDRLTRSLNDFYMLWDMLRKNGVEIIALNEGFDTSSAVGRAMISFAMDLAQLEKA
jgi:site-specific DNA recombinase